MPVPIPVRSATDVGAVIHDARRALGLSQRELADRAGVSRQWIVEIEGGKSRAELGLVIRTLDVLGVRLVVDDGSERPPAVAVVTGADIDALLDRAKGRTP